MLKKCLLFPLGSLNLILLPLNVITVLKHYMLYTRFTFWTLVVGDNKKLVRACGGDFYEHPQHMY